MGKALDRQTKVAKIVKQLGTFQKESHAKSLAEGIIRSCKDELALPGRIKQAKDVAKSIREDGGTSFFSAEYGKVFSDPITAVSIRRRLISEFKKAHGLPDKRAAKMADCIVFSAAKKADESAIKRLAYICSESLSAGIPFTIVADVVYYNAPEVSPEKFAKRCIETSIKRNKPLSISEVELAARISKALA